MVDVVSYPNWWKGQVPEGYDLVVEGKGRLFPSLFSCLDYFEHLCFRSWVPLPELRVLHLGCGTGEPLLEMAVHSPGATIFATDFFPESLEMAKDYARQIGVSNIHWLEPGDWGNLGELDMVLSTRPLQHWGELLPQLHELRSILGERGIFQVFSYTGSEPEKNLLFPDESESWKEGHLSLEEASVLVEKLLVSPVPAGIDTFRGVNQLFQEAGFSLLSGIHPKNYDPSSYLPDDKYDALLSGLSPLQRGFLSEQLHARFLRHAMVFSKQPLSLPKWELGSPECASWIPFQTPFAGAARKDDRILLGLVHGRLALQEGVEFEDLSLPEKYFQVFQTIDGKKTLEQVHRRFLPMSWEDFRAFVQLLLESELIYLHEGETS
ncbi:MAG TPA: class I SAM-dependent methyltransferase [Thermotogota bacterium]|nr:class I SAM-dependent methyltransferase [Thermotogota bacterium]